MSVAYFPSCGNRYNSIWLTANQMCIKTQIGKKENMQHGNNIMCTIKLTAKHEWHKLWCTKYAQANMSHKKCFGVKLFFFYTSGTCKSLIRLKVHRKCSKGHKNTKKCQDTIFLSKKDTNIDNKIFKSATAKKMQHNRWSPTCAAQNMQHKKKNQYCAGQNLQHLSRKNVKKLHNKFKTN